MDAVGGHHIRCDAGELLAAQAAVIRNTHRQRILRVRAAAAKDIIRQSLRGHPDRVFVHPVRPHTHQAAESPGAEFKILIKCILKARGIFIAELDDLGFGLRVEITRQPFLYIVEIVSHMIVNCFVQSLQI